MIELDQTKMSTESPARELPKTRVLGRGELKSDTFVAFGRLEAA